ncbi:MAG: shikimate dehydrogenase [Thermodesulfovibrionales bacterium]|nr:shikimate dehydrogenase [Thermodesulfovibrionales bacterium]
MEISGKTRVVALLGWPVGHSLSPRMHNAAFERMGLDYCYVTFPVRPELLGDAVKAVRALDLAGVNVTVPHKENVMPYLDRVDEEASFIGAVNTVVNKNGKLTGFNTDGRGFMRSLEEKAIEVKGKNILIIGTGGAARAISYYLCQEASKVFLFDIDTGKAEKLVRDLLSVGMTVYVPQSLDIAKGMDIIINATPLGLKESDSLPIDINLIYPPLIVVDLIYKETPLLREAKKKGCKTLNGMGMLLWQGVFAFELWTGEMPPVDVMQKALLEGLG